jgi:hypothetical protein
MKKMWLVLAGVVVLFLFVGIAAVRVQAACGDNCCQCQQFIDEDGDGICDLCNGCIPQGDDADGDGIPNGKDDDYTPPQDGSGKQNKKGR